MNQRIKEFEKQCWSHRIDGFLMDGQLHFDTQKFALLIIKDVADKLEPVLASEILELYGVEE